MQCGYNNVINHPPVITIDSWDVHHSQENGWFMTLLYPRYALRFHTQVMCFFSSSALDGRPGGYCNMLIMHFFGVENQIKLAYNPYRVTPESCLCKNLKPINYGYIIPSGKHLHNELEKNPCLMGT